MVHQSEEQRNTRRVYAPVIRDFMRFTSMTTPQAFRTVTRAYVFAWSDDSPPTREPLLVFIQSLRQNRSR